MPGIDAILFDKDGTLFDYHRTWANWSHHFLLDLADGDRTLASKLGDAVGFDTDLNLFDDDSLLVRDTAGDTARALLPLLPGASLTGIATRMAAMTATVPQAEATDLRALMDGLLARNMVLGVVTNDCIAPATVHLREAGIGDAFDHVIAADSGFVPKPAPDMLLAFCEFTGLDPSRVVMVGDSVHDMNAARAAGMSRVAVLTGPATRRQLEPLSEAVLDSIAELPDWLDRAAVRKSAA